MLLLALLAASAVVVSSPDKSIELSLSDTGDSYWITRNGEEVVAPSSMGLVFADAQPVAELTTVSVLREEVSHVLPLIATKADEATDHYNSARIIYREAGGARRQISVVARVYDDGVAFRYVLPQGSAYAIEGENTAFTFSADIKCHVSEYVASHENAWAALSISQLKADAFYDVPAVCATPSGRTHFAIAQSDIVGFVGSRLMPLANGFRVQLIAPQSNPEVAVRGESGLTSSWRVVMMGDRAGDLITSHVIGNLAPQPQGDFSWVRPGRVAWDWWSGPTAGAKPTMDRFKRFIDFAAESGFEYFLIDAGWAYGATPCCNPDPGTDITRPDPAIDMPALVQYAADRHVGLLLWAHWKHVEPRMAEVLDTYAAWGIKGIKVDFMERDDQEMISFYHDLAQATAERHLLLDMHGAYPPAGLQRTYPNYITQEGVLGAEWNKFSSRITPAHNVRLAYTRMLLGPMDYTPGGFSNATPETFVVRDVNPMTQTTRGQALAMYVVYDSPLQMVSDDPEAYVGARGFEFIKSVPAAWDETRFLGGTPETYVALARRKADTWYVGVMTNEEGREVELDLSFLGEGSYSVWQIVDGADPNSVNEQHDMATAKDRHTIKVKPAGGGVLVLKPVP